jgi:hypothetical protein
VYGEFSSGFATFVRLALLSEIEWLVVTEIIFVVTKMYHMLDDHLVYLSLSLFLSLFPET